MIPYPHFMEWRPGRRSSVVRRERVAMERPDEYEIRMTEDETLLRSATDAGFFYAEKTLKELPPGQIGVVRDWADVPLRIAMIDLKRISWNFDYLLSLFPLLADLRINACLMEYEDKFPYRFSDRIAVPGAFTADQIRRITQTARENHVELIPLVQCFSHWEYILRHGEFADLRESDADVSQGCPLNPRTFELFRSMLKEILEAHPECRYVHIGADEARLLGHCPACAAKVRESGVERLYGDYLEAAIDEVNSYGKTPLFWADFFWTHDRPLIRKNCIAVDWEYSPRAVRASSAIVGIRTLNYGEEAEHSRYAPYLKPEESSRTVFGFPHLLWLKDHSYRTFGAGNVNSSDNMLAHAAAAAEEHLPAVMGTYWASGDSLSMPMTLFPWRICGLAMLGAAGWNAGYEQRNHDSFYRRLSEKMDGSAENAEGFRQMDNQGAMIAPLRYREKPVVPEKGYAAFFGKKALLDYRFQNLFREERLYPETAYEMLSIGKVANSTPEFRIGEEECRFTVGRMDFVPRERFLCLGTPFRLTDRLAVYGDYPGQTTPAGIVLEVKERKHPEFLFVIQSLVGSVTRERSVGACVFHYSDRSSASIALEVKKNLDDWWNIEDSRELRIAFSNADCSGTLANPRLGLHCWQVENPHPEKELCSLEFRVSDRVVIALAAATLLQIPDGARPPADAVEKLRSMREELEQLSAGFRKTVLACSGRGSLEELENIAFASQKCFLDRMENMFSGKSSRKI